MLLGNEKIQNYFRTLVENDGLSHAYLFYGPEGVGKKSFALEISEVIGGPAIKNPDLKIIDKGSEEIHIADIRELKNFAYLTPFGKCKLTIINNAHNLGRDASNALLKILEEPPGKSVLFLISHLPKLLFATVVSRCQLIRFKPLKQSEILNYLIDEKKVKNEVAEFSAKLANGSLGLAVELANNFDNFQKNNALLNKLTKTDFKERFETAKKISGSPEDLKKIVGDWLIYSASLPEKKLAKELLHLNNIISKPQFNHRLALDDFLVNL
mgnify:CR=1 FL=1